MWNILVHICLCKIHSLGKLVFLWSGMNKWAEREEEFSKFVRLTMKKESVTNYTILETAS